uniref:ADH_zinc_N domain-containing protein n=1 Tax=Gongylonema pulchrum TaxID=637853 RepID=A0A183EIQ1_9BILA
LLCLLTAKAYGASRVVITDVVESRLKLAKELGALEAINVKDLQPIEAAQRICKAFNGFTPDAAVECSGVPVSTETAMVVIRL